MAGECSYHMQAVLKHIRTFFMVHCMEGIYIDAKPSFYVWLG